MTPNSTWRWRAMDSEARVLKGRRFPGWRLPSGCGLIY
jgi:hypothetical protein